MGDRDGVGSLRNMMMTGESQKCMTAAVEDMKVGDSERDSHAGLRKWRRVGRDCSLDRAIMV
jgi:hypothetical protein